MKLWGGRTIGGLGLLTLTACAFSTPPQAVTPPPTRPQVRLEQPAPIISISSQPNASSDALRQYYRRLQNDLLARGLMRTDGGGPDTPFTDTQLARNFVRIALYDEYVIDGVNIRADATPSRLRRWEVPVRMSVEFGAQVPSARRAKDKAEVAAYVRRLTHATGLPITLTASDPNYYVLFLNETERENSEVRLRQMVPGIAQSSLRAILNLPRDQLCIVVAFSEPGKSEYVKAVAVIRDEHPDLLRTSCIHEELAQGLGLANDSPAARPSIFNDDEEFGLLTTQDEMLLKMLYDRRLQSGMTPEQAAPIAQRIATELTGASES